MTQLTQEELDDRVREHAKFLDPYQVGGTRLTIQQYESIDKLVLDRADIRGAQLYGSARATSFCRVQANSAVVKAAECAEFIGADLRGVDFQHGCPMGANFYAADLRRATFDSADAAYAFFYKADLRDVIFTKTNLFKTKMRTARVHGVRWPSPGSVLLANWERLSPGLTTVAMAYDRSCHPDPDRFLEWVEHGSCPYLTDECDVQRAVNFYESTKLYDHRIQAPGTYELMRKILEECCDTDPGSDAETP